MAPGVDLMVPSKKTDAWEEWSRRPSWMDDGHVRGGRVCAAFLRVKVAELARLARNHGSADRIRQPLSG